MSRGDVSLPVEALHPAPESQSGEGHAGDRQADTQPKLRADAARNRALLLDAARDAFEAAPNGAQVSLEAIARAAGVGIGTLYRNFPTREVLVEALHRSELDEVVASAAPLLESHNGFDALRLWMNRYTRFVATKQGMADALRVALASGAIRKSETRDRINATVGALLAAGAADGSIRSDIDADDLTTMLVGIFVATGDAKDAERVRRMLDLLMAGLRPTPRSSPAAG